MAQLSKGALFTALVLIYACLRPATADVTVRNKCPYPLKVFYRGMKNPLKETILAANGGTEQLVLQPKSPSGVLWASRNLADCSDHRHATQLEFNMSPDNNPSMDFFDISLVHAFNQNVRIDIKWVDGVTPPQCKSIQCEMPSVDKWCKSPNYVVASTGGEMACINVNGTGTVNTTSTDVFKKECPQANVISTDQMRSCPSGTNYEAIFCPNGH